MRQFNSNEIWFTSDLHLFHKNVISLCDRPYIDVNEMWEDIKTKWNNKVKNTDTVFILGDFLWNPSKSKFNRILPQLNGKKVFIIGNHDDEHKIPLEEFEFISKLEEIQILNSNNNDIIQCTLCHFPLGSWNGSYKNNIQLFGHCHGKFPKERLLDNQMDIGWDIIYDLFSFDEIVKLLKK